MEIEIIGMEEYLYRRIPVNTDSTRFYEQEPNGKKLMVTTAAFLDREKKPSVDRAIRCNWDPNHSIDAYPRSGVVYLIAREVREVGLAEPAHLSGHSIDVVHRPLEQNYAHAQIEADPAISSDRTFKRLRTSLAFIVNDSPDSRWLIVPDG